MKCWSGRLLLTLLVSLALGVAARADMITPWSYSWTRSPISVPADNNGTGGISMTVAPLTPGTHVVGDSDINAVNLSTFSSAPAGTVDSFTNANYSLTVQLTDMNSNTSGSLTFHGFFSGTLSTTSAQIDNTFLNPLTQSIVLGQHDYTVALNTYVPPGLPDSTTFGSIGAHVSITDSIIDPPPGSGGGGGTGGGVSTVPEPSTLLLAGLAVPAGLALWRVRTGRRRETTAND
jgi:hypothetical protein